MASRHFLCMVHCSEEIQLLPLDKNYLRGSFLCRNTTIAAENLQCAIVSCDVGKKLKVNKCCIIFIFLSFPG